MTTFQPIINLHDHLTILDWAVFIIACLACIGITLFGQHRKNKLAFKEGDKASMLEYILMGRQLTLPLFIATLVSTWYGGIFGVTQIAFEQGIYNLFTQGIFWYLSYIIFAFFLVNKIRTYGAVSIPELVKKIYGHKSAKITAIFIFVKTLPITYAISIGIFLQCLLPLTLVQATCIGVSLIVLYSVSGGLRTVVYSDVALFIIMCLGVSLVLVFSIMTFGGISFLHSNLPSSYFNPCGTKSISNTVVWLLIAASTTFISPSFYQRCLAATCDKVAKRGILIATLIWFVFDLCTTFGAMYARAVLPYADSLNAYVIYGVQLLPAGFRGLLLASIAAAIIAALDSFLFIASNILFYDIPIFNIKNLKTRYVVAILAAAATTILLSIYFEGRIENAWLLVKSYFTAGLLLPLLFGYYFPKLANERIFILNSIVACSSITLWDYFFKMHSLRLDSFYIGCIASCAVFAAYFLAEKRVSLHVSHRE